MPQMSPMMWSILFFYFLFLLIFTMVLIYFFFCLYNFKNNNCKNSLNFYEYLLKW